jgi:hypothetical protein
MRWLRYALAPFYTDARRMIRLSGPDVDAYLGMGALARISGGDVTFSTADGGEYHEKVRVLGRRRAARWVNQFNTRAAKIIG